MRKELLFHILIVLMLMSILGSNFALQATAQQNATFVDAKTAAEYDAEDDVNTAVWIAAGGVLGVIGALPLGAAAIGGAYVYQPVPRVERLLGKSAEYVTVYTEAYKTKSRNLRLVAAVKGSLGGSAVFCLLGMVKIKPWADFVFW